MKQLWYPFDPARGSSQKLPTKYRRVLVAIPGDDGTGRAPGVAVGYLKFAAGDKQSPYFVIPGIGGDPSHWCDCLGDGFSSPHWNFPDQAPVKVHEPRYKALITILELAERLDLPATWLKEEALAGRIPCLRVGKRRMMFDAEAVQRALVELAQTGSGEVMQ